MKTETKLNVGHIPFLNCVPWFHYLADAEFSGRLTSGVPSRLNTLLQQGEIDVSPSSSFEYAQHWQDYLLLPGHSIASIGNVKSVLFFSPVELSQLDGQPISITGESATSINLLRLILREFNGLENVSDTVPSDPVESLIEQGKPALLIGDRALRLAKKQPVGMKIFDLGEIWYQQTGLPFVFALWMIRKEALEKHSAELTELSRQLAKSYQKVIQNAASIAELYSEQKKLSVAQIVDYWDSINYRLDENHLEGLRLFFQLCVKHKLLPQEPPIEFFQSSMVVMSD